VNYSEGCDGYNLVGHVGWFELIWLITILILDYSLEKGLELLGMVPNEWELEI
jgi:hypothetical protein